MICNLNQRAVKSLPIVSQSASSKLKIYLMFLDLSPWFIYSDLTELLRSTPDITLRSISLALYHMFCAPRGGTQNLKMQSQIIVRLAGEWQFYQICLQFHLSSLIIAMPNFLNIKSSNLSKFYRSWPLYASEGAKSRLVWQVHNSAWYSGEGQWCQAPRHPHDGESWRTHMMVRREELSSVFAFYYIELFNKTRKLSQLDVMLYVIVIAHCVWSNINRLLTMPYNRVFNYKSCSVQLQSVWAEHHAPLGERGVLSPLPLLQYPTSPWPHR